MRNDKLKEVVLVLIAFILIVFIIKYLKIFNYLFLILSILIPVFIGFIYAWLFNPLVRKLSRKFNRNVVCIVLFLLFILIVFLFLYLLIPIFYKEVLEFIVKLPSLFGNFEQRIDNMGFKVYLDKVLVFLVDNVPGYLINFLSSLVKYLGVIGIGLILGLYLSMDYEKVIKNICFLVPKKYKCVGINLILEVSDEVHKCVNGTLFVAFCVFVMDSLSFLFIGVDAPLLFGVLCGITDLIPYIGPYIGGIVVVLVGFTESRIVGILTIIAVIVVQSIENYILQPIVMSKSIKISPALIIIGLLIFGNLFGIIGMIIATPCVAVIKVIMVHLVSVLEKCKE